MQSQQPSPASQNYSQVSIKFGNNVQTSNSNPFSINLCAEYCSSKIENKRFNTEQYLNQKIPAGSVLMEVDSKVDGQQLAEKIKTIIDKLDQIKQKIQDKSLSIKVIGKGNKVYILLNVEAIQQALTKFNQNIQKQNMLPVQQRWLDVKIASANKLSRFQNLMEQKGVFGAFLDSLLINVRFNKSENIRNMVKQILKPNMGEVGAGSVVDSFEYVNLDLKFQSAQTLQNYPQALQNIKIVKLNDDFNTIKSLLGNKIQMYLFGKPISFTLSLSAQQMYLVLDLLFA